MAAALVVVAGAACGTPPPEWTIDAGTCVPYQVPAGEDLMTPTVSLKTDVMTVFSAHCQNATCHGSTENPTGDLFLGEQSAHGGDSAQVFSAIVGVTSDELTSMDLVTAGAPASSYLMHKMDGDQCQFVQRCVNNDCQVGMPQGSMTISSDERDTVRRWIAQGASDN